MGSDGLVVGVSFSAKNEDASQVSRKGSALRILTANHDDSTYELLTVDDSDLMAKSAVRKTLASSPGGVELGAFADDGLGGYRLWTLSSADPGDVSYGHYAGAVTALTTAFSVPHGELKNPVFKRGNGVTALFAGSPGTVGTNEYVFYDDGTPASSRSVAPVNGFLDASSSNVDTFEFLYSDASQVVAAVHIGQLANDQLETFDPTSAPLVTGGQVGDIAPALQWASGKPGVVFALFDSTTKTDSHDLVVITNGVARFRGPAGGAYTAGSKVTGAGAAVLSQTPGYLNLAVTWIETVPDASSTPYDVLMYDVMKCSP